MQHFQKPCALGFGDLKAVFNSGRGCIDVREHDAQVCELRHNGKV